MLSWALQHVVRVTVFVAAAAVLLGAAEWAHPRPVRTGDRAERRRHLAWIGAWMVYAPPVGAISAWLASDLDARARATEWWIGPTVGEWPWWVRAMIALALFDLVAYGVHRASHRWRPLWAIHAVHHRATDVRWWTAMRFHPIGAAIDLTVPVCAAAICGVGLGAQSAVTSLATVVTLFAHADVEVPWRRIDRLIATPRFHRRHHERGRGDDNFALILPIVDVVFGSARFHGPDAARFGIGPVSADEDRPHRERTEVGDAAHDGSSERVAVSTPYDRPLGQ